MKSKTYLLIVSIFLISIGIEGQSTQWRVENRDGIYNEKGLLKEWPKDGPEKILVVEKIGKGWSSVK